MKYVQQGSLVTVSYVGTLDNGRIFHSTEQAGPLIFTIGSDQVFPALEEQIVGMRCGEVKNIVLTAEQAYGVRLSENIIEVARSSFPAGKEITVGQKLSIEFRGGVAKVMMVNCVTDSVVTLDGNHPLAGCELTFALKVEQVEDAC